MDLLKKGKLNIGCIDASAGSSGKAKFNDLIAFTEQVDFAISQNSNNASHIVCFDEPVNGFTEYKFNALPTSCTSGCKVVMGADAMISLPKMLEEMKDWGYDDPERLFIHPNMVVITGANVKWEEENLGYLGSTMTGGGAARGMKVMRVPGLVTADQVEKLKPYIANTNELVIEWLQKGETGVLETAQGFDLSMDLVFNNPEAHNGVDKFYPFSTSRSINPTYFAGLSFVPHQLIGNVFLNLRTFPIRVGDASTANGNIIFKLDDGSEESGNEQDVLVSVGGRNPDHSMVFDNTSLTFEEVSRYYDHGWNLWINKSNKSHTITAKVSLGTSGKCYPDQEELSWEDVTKYAGSEVPIKEQTSLTKRVRRVFGRSVAQLRNSTMSCMPTHITINFVNYLDASIEGVSGKMKYSELKDKYPKVAEFVKWTMLNQYWAKTQHMATVPYLGTGAKRSEYIELEMDIEEYD